VFFIHSENSRGPTPKHKLLYYKTSHNPFDTKKRRWPRTAIPEFESLRRICRQTARFVISHWHFQVFSYSRKAPISFVISVPTYRRDSHWTDFYEIWYCRLIWKPVGIIQIWLQPGNLHEDLSAFCCCRRH